MSELQRQHPAAALAKSFDIIRQNIITVLVILFIGGGGEQSSFTLYWLGGSFLFLLIWGIASWYRFRFRVEEGELTIEHGVIIKKKLYLTSDRIQVIDISAGVVQRLFGLVAVEVKTAGSTSKQAKINAISRQRAEELKRLLRSKENLSTEVGETNKTDEKIYALEKQDLLVAATTSGQLGVALSVVGGAFSQLDQIVSEEQMIRFVENNIPRATSLTVILATIIVALVVSWGFSFLSTIIKYYDFEVVVRNDELLISRGLFERTQLTIPFDRIQAVQIKEELLRQPFGYASLVIESAGYGEKEGNSATLFPIIHKHKMFEFIDEVIPEYHVQVKDRAGISRLGLRRYLLRMLWITLPAIALGWAFVPYGVFAWVLLVPALVLGYQQWRDAEVASAENTLVMTSRLLSKTTAIIKKYRMQATRITQNPFQSRLDLCNLTVYVASGNQGRSFTVRELTEQHAFDYRDWLAGDSNSQKDSTDTDFKP